MAKQVASALMANLNSDRQLFLGAMDPVTVHQSVDQ